MTDKETMEAGRSLLAELDRLREENARLAKNYQLLADEAVYEGNSISWTYRKAIKYRDALERAWSAMAEAGYPADGETELSDAIRAALLSRECVPTGPLEPGTVNAK